jgi:WD40 repeat protein/energy-coupling factor transporter ATP-binding protein EcfA2
MTKRAFVVYAAEDEEFVLRHLVPGMGIGGEDVLLSSRLELGQPMVTQLAEGALCPVTVLVISPAFLACPWSQFADELAQHCSVVGGNGKSVVVPAILADCDLPLLVRFRVPLDFRNRQKWQAESERLRELVLGTTRPWSPPPCPYPGMRPFSADCASNFHGRAKEIEKVAFRLREGKRDILVIGPSGSGKSSLLHAGVLPNLATPSSLVGQRFAARSMRPGADPVSALAHVLAADERTLRDLPSIAPVVAALLSNEPSAGRLLITIDQFEEVFSVASTAARQAFFAMLRRLRTETDAVLLYAVRADFYGALMDSPLWADLDGRIARVDVGPLRGPALRRAIEEPARAAGIHLQVALLERLVADAADEPGALPLLQETLAVLWSRLGDRLLRLVDYETMGGTEGTGLAATVARVADGALAELSTAQQRMAQRVFLRLVQFGKGRADTRRQQPRDALVSGDDAAQVDAVLGHLVDRRLLTTVGNDGAAAGIDVAHEVLLASWPALRGWVAARRLDEERRRSLESKAVEWAAKGRGNTALLDKGQLSEVESWRSIPSFQDLGLDATSVALVEASRTYWRDQAAIEAARVRELEEQRAAARLQLARNYVSHASLLLLKDQGAKAVPYLVAARDAGIDDVAVRAMFRWAAGACAESTLRHDGVLWSMRWSPDGQRIVTASEHSAWVWDVTSRPVLHHELRHPAAVSVVRWSRDGTLLATGGYDDTVRIWSAGSGTCVGSLLPHGDRVTSVAWSPDGRRLATASRDGFARIWLADGSLVSSFDQGALVRSVEWDSAGERVLVTSRDAPAALIRVDLGDVAMLKHAGGVLAAAWDGDGSRVATGGGDGTMRVWDATSARELLEPIRHSHPVINVAWSPDGRRLATSVLQRTAYVWDVTSGARVCPPLEHRRVIESLAWSPDGSWIATASGDRMARIWDTRTGQARMSSLEHHDVVMAVTWRPDGKRVATAGVDCALRIWDTSSLYLEAELKHDDAVVSAAWSGDGQCLATASTDKTARIWGLRDNRPAGRVLEHDGAVVSAQWSPDGARVVTACENAKACLWDVSSRSRIGTPLLHDRMVNAVAWSVDGSAFATASRDGFVRIWKGSAGLPMNGPLEHGGSVAALAWSRDGNWIATASDDGAVRVWDVRVGQLVAPLLRPRGGVATVAWSPDGRCLAASGDEPAVRIWDVGTWRENVLTRGHLNAVVTLAWSPDGTRIATGSLDATARIWDRSTGRALSAALEHQGAVRRVAWSPDGRRVATASYDGTARVWDARGGYALTPPLEHLRGVSSVAWSPDGKRLVTSSWDGTARIWNVSWDEGGIDDWRDVLSRCGYLLTDEGVQVAGVSGDEEDSFGGPSGIRTTLDGFADRAIPDGEEPETADQLGGVRS